MSSNSEFTTPDKSTSVSLDSLISMKDNMLDEYRYTIDRIADIKNWSGYATVLISAFVFFIADIFQKITHNCSDLYKANWLVIFLVLYIVGVSLVASTLSAFVKSIKQAKTKPATSVTLILKYSQRMIDEGVPDSVAEKKALEWMIFNLSKSVTHNKEILTSLAEHNAVFVSRGIRSFIVLFATWLVLSGITGTFKP